jgi:hypothetical protein
MKKRFVIAWTALTVLLAFCHLFMLSLKSEVPLKNEVPLKSKLKNEMPDIIRCPVDYFAVINSMKLERCTQLKEYSVFMIWTTEPSTFSPRNQWAVESLFKHNPCVSLSVYSNTLPINFFATYQGFGLDIKVVPYALSDGSFGLHVGSPGSEWLKNIDKWKKSNYFHVHSSDFLRLVLLYEHGGTYMDMDHINIAPLFTGGTCKLGKNVIGSEVCQSDNPDCLQVSSLMTLDVLDASRVNSPVYPSRDGFQPFNSSEKLVLYTPCNDVLINWEKKHPLIRDSLRHIDKHYNPKCRGCMGSRLMGRLLLNKAAEEMSPKYNMQVLAPGVLYPFDSTHMALVMSNRSSVFESFIKRSQPYGVHFFGSGSSTSILEINSTMGMLVRENSLFGHLPYVDVVRIPGSKHCRSRSAQQDVVAIRKMERDYLTQNALQLRNIMSTYPSDLFEFYEMARITETVLVCHQEWFGIRQMTLRIADHLSIPVIMVGDFTLKDHMFSVKKALEVMGVRKLHFQGIPPFALEFSSYLRSSTTPHAVRNKFINEWVVSVSYHSGISVHNIAHEESVLLGKTMNAAAKGDVLLTFLEHDQAAFSSRLGAPACAVLPTFVHVPKFTRHISLKPSADPNVLRIGLLGTGTRLAVKNYFTQIGAACMFRDVEIHVNEVLPAVLAGQNVEGWYISRCGSRIVEHGVLKSSIFRKELSTFDINLYVSWTDAVPNVVLDSLAAGVPVIVSDVTSIFDSSPKLKSLLVESRIDDPRAIYRRTVHVLEYVKQHKAEFRADILDLFKFLRAKAFNTWRCFLNSTVVDMKCADEASGECVGITM